MTFDEARTELQSALTLLQACAASPLRTAQINAARVVLESLDTFEESFELAPMLAPFVDDVLANAGVLAAELRRWVAEEGGLSS